MKNLKLLFIVFFALGGMQAIMAQTTVNLADQCNCDVHKPGTEVTVGATAPAGNELGDLLVDASGDIFYWDGDSWEYPITGGLMPTVANTAAVTSPVDGQMIYDASENCFKAYQAGAWSSCMGAGATAGTVASLDNCASPTVAGTIEDCSPVSGASFTVNYSGGNGGDYCAEVVNSTGVTGLVAYSTSGTLASGAGSVTYTIIGTPSTFGTADFVINLGGQTCTVSVPVTFPTVTSTTGKVWMAKNLGATAIPISRTDEFGYGDLYQWGRLADGHEERTSATCWQCFSSTDNPGSNEVISGHGSDEDWRVPSNSNLWQGVNGINNPCPAGFRVPTEQEWTAEFNAFSTANASGAFNSPLKLPKAGYKTNGGVALNGGDNALYWSSTNYSVNDRAIGLFLEDASGQTTPDFVADKMVSGAIRCIQN